MASNNNCAIELHEGRLFLAFRTAPTHFASPKARMYVVSSADLGRTWAFELGVAGGADAREPAFISLGGRLIFQWFDGGTDALAFEPRRLRRTIRSGPAKWTPPEEFGEPGEVVWDVKVRDGRAWRTSYRGGHYALGEASVEVRFQVSTDGLAWAPVDAAHPVVYRGGLSEVAFEFDAGGALIAMGRNEDGDRTGFGSLVATAPADAPGRWTWPERSDPERYDSPEMFRHGDAIYLLARRDIGGPFDRGARALPFERQRIFNLAAYSLRPKRTALFRMDGRRPVHLLDLPSAGDTAFPSVVSLGGGRFLVANYTSPPEDPDRSWLRGQTSVDGTRIYLQIIDL